MKVLAMYLPQFHRVRENDEWWGDGFTDWKPTREAVPLFENHYQPHIPFKNNYYDLLQKETLRWQADLMHQYGIDGMCMYHYWFKDGRQILEKPVENLLEWKDIDMPFCLYWANESWIRSWSKLKNANAWTNDSEVKQNDDTRGILLEQSYGEKEEWRAHFEYLLPFFKDDRYIKIDGKPVFMIYKCDSIYCIEEMLEYWRALAKENGFPDLYVIGAYADSISKNTLDAKLRHEPPKSIGVLREEYRTSDAIQIDYKKINDYILGSEISDNTYLCAFPGYDDTPRRGKNGVVLTESNPDEFEKYLRLFMAKNEKAGLDITFINAWNEWGEGMHLEPDEKYGDALLLAIKNAKETYKKDMHNLDLYEEKKADLSCLEKRAEKFEKYLNALDTWMTLREEGKSLVEYFYRRNISKIAIYGYGILGRHLEVELKDSSVQVVGIIDKQKEKIISDYPVYFPSELLPDCDAIVVSAFYFLNEIMIDLPKNCEIISLEEIINEVCLL